MTDAAIGHVSDTAFLVAQYRAAESARPDALFNGPFCCTAFGCQGTRDRGIDQPANDRMEHRYPHKHSDWYNTRIVDDLLATVRGMKKESGDDLVILGSGTIVAQLTQQNLIDIFQIVVNPVVLGKGRTMFEGLDRRLDLHQTESRTFGNGNTLLTYEAIR